MNAPVNLQQASSSYTQRAPERSSAGDRVCWVEIKHYSYQLDHQVELLHLQAEADALLLELQTLSQKRQLQGAASQTRDS